GARNPPLKDRNAINRRSETGVRQRRGNVADSHAPRNNTPETRLPGCPVEYIAENPGGYSYSRFCELYRAFESRLPVTMRQTHPAGERLFVDYAGDGVPGAGRPR